MGLVFGSFSQIFPPHSTVYNVETVESYCFSGKIPRYTAVFDILTCGKLCGKVKTYVNSGKPDYEQNKKCPKTSKFIGALSILFYCFLFKFLGVNVDGLVVHVDDHTGL